MELRVENINLKTYIIDNINITYIYHRQNV